MKPNQDNDNLVLQPLTATEFLILRTDYESTLSSWVTREMAILKQANASTSILTELMVTNAKLIATSGDDGKVMRAFLFDKPVKAEEKTRSLVISRLFNLLIYIRQAYPTDFLSRKKRLFIDSMKEDLSYDSIMDEHVIIAMLITDIQFVYNYRSN